jgi:hypothetical protein
METTEYTNRLQGFTQNLRRVRDEAEGLLGNIPSEIEKDAPGDLVAEIQEISEMLREELEAALERAVRITQMTEMILLVRGE